MLCGATYALLQSISSSMELSMFSHTTYDKVQRAYVAPVAYIDHNNNTQRAVSGFNTPESQVNGLRVAYLQAKTFHGVVIF